MDVSLPEKAKEFIQSAGVKIEDTKVYNIYECGCIFDNDIDPIMMAYFPETKITNRSCPTHKPTALHIKYKRCKCGFENTGMRLQKSIRCNKCKNVDKAAIMKDLKRRQNLHLKDIGKCDCNEYLNCLDKYLDCECVPCKNCKRYLPGSANIDPLVGVYRKGFIRRRTRR